MTKRRVRKAMHNMRVFDYKYDDYMKNEIGHIVVFETDKPITLIINDSLEITSDEFRLSNKFIFYKKEVKNVVDFEGFMQPKTTFQGIKLEEINKFERKK